MTYIGRTDAYYDEEQDWVFTPAMWKWVSDPMKLAGEVHCLKEAGEELLDRWCEDVSVGYDLCNGRAKGLAAEYSSEQMWELLTSDKQYSYRMDNFIGRGDSCNNCRHFNGVDYCRYHFIMCHKPNKGYCRDFDRNEPQSTETDSVLQLSTTNERVAQNESSEPKTT